MKKRVIIILSVFAVFIIGLTAASATWSPFADGSGLFSARSNAQVHTKQHIGSPYRLEFNDETLGVAVVDPNTGRKLLESGNIVEDPLDGDGKVINNNGLPAPRERIAKSGVMISYKASASSNRVTDTPFLDFKSTLVNVTEVANGFNVSVSILDINIKFTMQLRLDKDALSIKIPYESIVESTGKANRLTAISLYRFMNATRGKQPHAEDYIFIPDGPGGLIDLTKPTTAVSNYSARVYGADMGIIGTAELAAFDGSQPPERILVPAFGMTGNEITHDKPEHNTDANAQRRGYIAHIDSGAEFSAITANMFGIDNWDYNFVYSTFYYRENYSQPWNNSGGVYPVTQEDKNVFDIGITYMVLDDQEDVNYSGMANRLRAKYIADGILNSKSIQSGNIPLKADFFMASGNYTSFGRKVIAMTEANYVKDKLETLKNKGVSNIQTSLVAYNKGGEWGSGITYGKLEGKTGSNADYKALVDYANENKIKFALAADYVRADTYINEFSKREVAMTISKQAITMPDYIWRWLMYGVGYDDLTIMNLETSLRHLKADLKDFEKLNVNTVQLNTLGNITASSHFNAKYTRSQAIEKELEMAELANNIILDKPNDYLWKTTDEITNIPLSNSGFVLALESVPFIQMLLSGTTNMYSSHINLAHNGIRDILSMIDYGVYPSYLLTDISPVNLVWTRSEYIFSSEYNVWESEMLDTYNKVNDVLKHVRGKQMIAHKKLATNVYKSTYSNGVEIIVNYGSKPHTEGTLTVGAQSWEVL